MAAISMTEGEPDDYIAKIERRQRDGSIEETEEESDGPVEKETVEVPEGITIEGYAVEATDTCERSAHFLVDNLVIKEADHRSSCPVVVLADSAHTDEKNPWDTDSKDSVETDREFGWFATEVRFYEIDE